VRRLSRDERLRAILLVLVLVVAVVLFIAAGVAR